MPNPDRYARSLSVIAQDPDPQIDGFLVILTPQAMTDPTETARQLLPYAKLPKRKPVIASWMGGLRRSSQESKFSNPRGDRDVSLSG